MDRTAGDQSALVFAINRIPGKLRRSVEEQTDPAITVSCTVDWLIVAWPTFLLRPLHQLAKPSSNVSSLEQSMLLTNRPIISLLPVCLYIFLVTGMCIPSDLSS